MTPCRLYVLPAAAAPTAVIMRRGPSAWWHLLAWDLQSGELSSGAWLRGMLYPGRSALSPDGKLLGYFALGHGRHPWDTYFAVSKTPWLTALAAWHTHGTWTGGCEFAADNSLTISASMDERPFHGRYPYGATVGTLTRRRDGWRPLTGASGLLRRVQPGGEHALITARTGSPHYLREDAEGGRTPLPEAAWADWDGRGRLLVATHQGAVKIVERRSGTWVETWSRDLNGLTPAPAPSPSWARAW
ncbi:hypothetical protein JOL79_10615 [Microbispora sp. RL4-1S]|uniref:Uncharacterized protein n=1 Tax=Microbispora oryzae TaxID=2806554 RepID=A0A941AJJ3_9ACTN|nr:hypothetical protein [Microbispora oryzae]MBP2704263.1 hypothetical protein [Microbispora oryzae]